jgi:hypothetical protein
MFLSQEHLHVDHDNSNKLTVFSNSDYDRSFVLILTRDNGCEPKKVCKRCDDSYLRVGRVASAFYRRGYTLFYRLSALPYWLSDGCIVSAATEKGGQLGTAGLAGEGTKEI